MTTQFLLSLPFLLFLSRPIPTAGSPFTEKYAVDCFHNALAFMDQLGTPGTPSFHDQIWKTNVQLTAAGTNAQTCQESFDIVKDGPLKTEVSNRVDDLSKLAGNALSLLVKIG
ncbi:uncharacterized protein [Malus domestica]|uniref:uncharacterized protein n=1 Tax=Malus domestica TaxID=3750 RepID=UPI0039767082